MITVQPPAGLGNVDLAPPGVTVNVGPAGPGDLNTTTPDPPAAPEPLRLPGWNPPPPPPPLLVVPASAADGDPGPDGVAPFPPVPHGDAAPPVTFI